MCHCPAPNCCIDISEVQRFNMTLEPLPAGFETCLTHRTCASYFHSRELGSNENTAGGAYCHRRISSCIALVCTQQILRIFYRTLGIAVAAGHKNMLRRPSLQADLWHESLGWRGQDVASRWVFCKHDSTARGIAIAAFRIGTKLSAFLGPLLCGQSFVVKSGPKYSIWFCTCMVGVVYTRRLY